MSNLYLLLFSVFMGSIGQVLLKKGAQSIDEAYFTWDKFLYGMIKTIKIPEIVLGLILFGMSFLLWLKVLTKAELSYAYPMVSLGYLNVLILSYFLFHEQFTLYKVLGTLMIVSGVFVLNN